MKKLNKSVNIKILLISKIIIFSLLCSYTTVYAIEGDSVTKEQIISRINDIFINRNKAILNGDLELIESIFDSNSKYGMWAYEYEKKKTQYIHDWEKRQGVKFTEINPTIVIKKINGNDTRYSAYLLCSTEYKYTYEDTPDLVNTSRIGTSHIIQLVNKNGIWVITKEWYKDPFADSLKLDIEKNSTIKNFIMCQSQRDLSNLNKRRLKAVEYATQYCGSASEEQYGFKYNSKYRDYNPQGGDCANFASQILFEGGNFKKNSSWNYDSSGATRAWLNADGFKSYMIYSGRASVLTYGSFDKVYKASFKLLPGDFVAYEKKGDITHISTVTALDSKGYPLVTCHNTDRCNVPWDLGWSDNSIKFWLVHVHY